MTKKTNKLARIKYLKRRRLNFRCSTHFKNIYIINIFMLINLKTQNGNISIKNTHNLT